MNFELNNTIKMLNAYSNVDALYGPYTSTTLACLLIPKGLRGRGLTVGVINSESSIDEYQWKRGVEDEDLELKIEKLSLTLEAIGETAIDVDENAPIVLRFNISGRAIIAKGYLYQVVGTSEVFLSEFTSMAKGDNSLTITAPKTSGVYKYRIKIVDSSGYYAKTPAGEEYLEYTIKYGGITVEYNLTNFDYIQIKNIYSVAEKYFTCDISVRDDSFEILGVYLIDKDKTVSYSLLPYKTITEQSDTYLGHNYYILPDSTALEPFDGKFCQVRIAYTEDGVSRELIKELFTMLKADSLELISLSIKKDYYVNLPDYYTFLLRSGVASLSVYITQDPQSDFTFEPVTVSTYNNFSLRIIPKNVQTNAVLKMNCRFVINNIEKTVSFEQMIGNINALPDKTYYEPDVSGSVTLDKAIIAQEGDFVEDASYYKVIDDFTTDQYNTNAFIVDMYCRINQVNDKTLKYVSIYQGSNEIGYVTEDIINCRGFITDTPLNEWVQISIAYNVSETVNRNNLEITTSYHAIYINGMIVKNAVIDETKNPALPSGGGPITINLANGINVQKCLVYYKNNGQSLISPKATVYSIVYTNYLAHNPNFEEPADLPVLKLMRITNQAERAEWFDLIKEHNENLRHLTTFGTIGLEKASTMNVYDPEYDSSDMDRDNATLFRQSVNIKKPALKEYAVLCKGKYIVDGLDLLEGCVIEIHTQGTSTLVYAVPNFKFTFWKKTSDGIERYNPPFIEKGDGTYYQESVYTAKADFMDSSHLNNTPTCNFYNNLVQLLIQDDSFSTFVGSPSAANGNLDAIMGFPIVLEISDNASNIEDVFINIGSFMLNVDKTGDSLGFEAEVDGQIQSCISFEGTSNDNEHGAAGRFILDSRLDYFENDAAIDAAYASVQLAITNKLINEPGELDPIGDLTGYPYAQWCQFLSDGLEYRYPDSDIIKSKNKKLSKVMKLSDFKKLYRMWSWVSQSDSYSTEKYCGEFELYFDLTYCMLYFIQLMIFAQTDNLGKNAMFDCWDGSHWFPRPYDLDSQAGLDNNGNDNIAPFVEIKPEFSLNYNPRYTPEEMAENYLLESSKILYGTQRLDRYHYSSNSSKLWINFYNNYKDRIEAFYTQLRNSGRYSADAIIQLCQSILINKLGVLQYNQDFNNKYLATSDQELAYGNRWVKFKKWMKQRFAFCDSYFGAQDIGNYDLVSAITYNVEVESPQYITQTYQANSVTKFVIDRTSFTAGSSAATKISLVVNLDQVLNTNLFKYVKYGSGARNYSNIIAIDVSGNDQIPTIESLVGTDLSNLKELNISNSSVTTLNHIPLQMKKLVAENVALTSIIFHPDSLIEDIDLKGSTITGNVSFDRLRNLKKLDLTNCVFNGNVTLANLESLTDFIISGALFKGSVIIQNGVNIDTFDFSKLSVNNIVFDGNNINITKLNFCETTFGQDTMNLDAISNNVEEIYFNSCSNLLHLQLTSGVKFGNQLRVFSIRGSSIKSLGSNSTIFDASCFNNISGLLRVNYISSTGAITYVPFTFQETKVVNVQNILWNGTGSNLFNYCTDLEQISGTLNLTNSIDYLFYRCSKLATLPTINIANSVTSASYAFCATNALSYSDAEAILIKCTHVNNFSYFCFGMKFANDTTIRLTLIFANNVASSLNLTLMFGPGGYSTGVPSIRNQINISGKIPASVSSTYRMFPGSTITSVPYDILTSAASLTNAGSMFASCNITFIATPNYPLPFYEEVVDDESVTTILTNAVDSRFFPTSLSNISSMFYNSNVQTIDSNVFRNLNNLTTCASCFSGGIRQFSKELIVNNLWSNNPNLTNISACFKNVRNVYCTGALRFHNNVSSINMSALFGLTSAATSSPITISLNIIVPQITTSSEHGYDGGTGWTGVFENRRVYITDNTDVLYKLRGNCERMFYGAHLYLNDNVTELDLTNITSCSSMFQSCTLHKYDTDIDTSTTNHKFVDIMLPTACRTYASMFRSSILLNSLPTLRSATTENTSYMYANAVINSSNVILPYNYFLICKGSILNTSYMFYLNIYLTELQYDSQIGLFSDCTKMVSVLNMFNGAHYLHKGIPNNFFGSTTIPNLVSLLNMFAETSIFNGVEDFSTNSRECWVDSNTFAPLTRLNSIEGMFQRNRPVYLPSDYTFRAVVKNKDGNDVTIINPNTFLNSNLSSIRYLFKLSSNIGGIEIAFLRFEYADEAFYDSSVNKIAQEFILNLYVPEVRSVQRMFSQFSSRYVENAGTFITVLMNNSSASMVNMASNLTNPDIPSSLTEPISGASWTGFSVAPAAKPIYS